MKQFLYLVQLIFLVFFLSIDTESCRKLNLDRQFRFSAIEIDTVTQTSATIHSQILDLGPGIDDMGYCWGVNKDPTFENSKIDYGPQDSLTTLQSIINDLLPDHNYYVRSFILSNNTVYFSGNYIFHTRNYSIPSVVNTGVTNITSSHARAMGKITSYGDGFNTVIKYGHCWSLSNPPTINDYKTEFDTLDQPDSFESYLPDLTVNKTYYIRGYAINDFGTGYSSTDSFNTIYTVPKLEFNVIKDSITSHSVYMSLKITDRGGSALSEYGFKMAYDKFTPFIIMYTNQTYNDVFSGTYDNLTPDTEYEVLGYAINKTGVGDSKSVIFKTLP